MSTLWQDIKYGVRTLKNSPGFTLVAVLTLALGIGANTTIFSWVNAMLLDPLPGVPRSGEILEVTFLNIEGRNLSFSYPNFEDVRDRNTTLKGIAVHAMRTLNLAANDGAAERVWGVLVSGNFFDVLEVKPILGRTFQPEENEVPSRNPVTVIGYGLWQRTFGGDPEIVGKQITLNKHSFTIIGVTAPEFQGPLTGLDLDLYVPMMMQHELVAGGDRLKARGYGWLQTKARLQPGVTLAQAQAELDTLAAQLATDYPGANEGRSLALYPLWKSPFGAQLVMGPVLLVLLGIAGMVLLIACANVANLLLARATARRKEIALRLALGAQRVRLIRQLLTERILLSMLGGALAMVAAYWTSGLMSALFPPIDFPIKMQSEVDGTVLVFSLIVSVLTGLLFGLAPAWQSTKADLVRALNDESGHSSGSRSKGRLRNTLVVAQVSLSLVLLISAGLFVRSLQQTQTLQPGFTIQDVLLTTVDLFPKGYSREEGHTFVRQLLDQAGNLPGVEQAALARYVPLNLGGASDGSVRVEGYEPGPNERVWSYFNTVSPNYFRTIGIPLIQGRDFTPQDTNDTEPVTIISERMARQYWKDQDPLGQKIRQGGTDYTVVGVAGDITYRFLNEDPVRLMYFPVFQSSRQGMTLHLKTSGTLGSLPTTVREVVRGLDPSLPAFGVQTLQRATSAAGIQQRVAGSMIGVFGLLALLLASVGLYGVLAYAVGQRTHEIGIRMALGARPWDILQLILTQGGLLIGIGTVLGLAGAFGLAQAVSSLLYGVSPTDPLIYGGTTLVLIAVSLLACYVPAWRASRVDPMVALRYE